MFTAHDSVVTEAVRCASTGQRSQRVILFAKHADAHKNLNEQFSNRRVLPKAAASSKTPIHQFGSGRMGVDLIRGKHSMTTFEVTQRFNSYSLLHAIPVTGPAPSNSRTFLQHRASDCRGPTLRRQETTEPIYAPDVACFSNRVSAAIRQEPDHCSANTRIVR